MDIARPDLARKRRRKRLLWTVIGLASLGGITFALSRLEPAAPSADKSAMLFDTVKRGDFVRDVRGNGVLAPEDIRFVTATNAGLVERILLLPGVEVKPENPELEQDAVDAAAAVESAMALLDELRVKVESERLTVEATTATLRSELELAKIEADADEELLKDCLVPKLTAKSTRAKATELAARYELEKKRLAISAKSAEAQIRAKETDLAKLRKQHTLKQKLVEALTVRAGVVGVLQRIGDDLQPLQVGQQVAIGANLARIANPTKLKAEIKIIETQARDIQHGQKASIDTRNGVIPGHVVRIDPASQSGTRTVDVTLDGPLPKGAVAELSVDGTIILERLVDVLHVGRPVNAAPESQVTLFKVTADGDMATRVPVRLGRNSVSLVEIVSGLQVGDRIILSDTSQWDGYDRIKLDW